MSGQPVHRALFPGVSRATRIEVETLAENEFGLTRSFVNIVNFEHVVKKEKESMNCSICNNRLLITDLKFWEPRLNYFFFLVSPDTMVLRKINFRSFERVWNGSFFKRDLSNVRSGLFLSNCIVVRQMVFWKEWKKKNWKWKFLKILVEWYCWRFLN